MGVRERISKAVTDRIAELGLTVPQVAQRAGVDPTTVRAFVKGRTWPHPATRDKISAALGWDEEEIANQAIAGHEQLMSRIPTVALTAELHRRATADEL